MSKRQAVCSHITVETRRIFRSRVSEFTGLNSASETTGIKSRPVDPYGYYNGWGSQQPYGWSQPEPPRSFQEDSSQWPGGQSYYSSLHQQSYSLEDQGYPHYEEEEFFPQPERKTESRSSYEQFLARIARRDQPPPPDMESVEDFYWVASYDLPPPEHKLRFELQMSEFAAQGAFDVPLSTPPPPIDSSFLLEQEELHLKIKRQMEDFKQAFPGLACDHPLPTMQQEKEEKGVAPIDSNFLREQEELHRNLREAVEDLKQACLKFAHDHPLPPIEMHCEERGREDEVAEEFEEHLEEEDLEDFKRGEVVGEASRFQEKVEVEVQEPTTRLAPNLVELLGLDSLAVLLRPSIVVSPLSSFGETKVGRYPLLRYDLEEEKEEAKEKGLEAGAC